MQRNIYIQLLEEGTKVYRPVPAIEIENNIYEVLGFGIFDPEDEVWEFPSGTCVLVEEQNLDGENVLVAIQEVCSNMRSRKKILKDLVLLQGSIEVLEKELSQYPRDIEKPLLKINVEDFSNVLKRSIINEIDFETLTNWANAIECRDDVEFENEEMQEVIFELANPEIIGEITKERLGDIIIELEK